MANVAVAVQSKRNIARPLKILVPMIQGELAAGNSAAHDHYRHAGEMLIEARQQVTHGSWGRWLTKNFDLSRHTAAVYMQWARHAAEQMARPSQHTAFSSLNEMRGGTERRREERQAKQQQQLRRLLREVPRDDFAQERQRREDEIKLHRELALQLIDLGYRALATKLHPDRGGSRDAMMRLNHVRDELKSIAEARRFT
jgi:uncharacterized Zn finger protein (UPF0148 family)